MVADAAGKPVLSQLVDMDGDDEPDELVFQTDLAASQTKTFKLRTGPRTPPVRGDFMVYGRFVRERIDDFAWENDLVAHRVYGPALETAAKEPLVSSGIDTWVKKVRRLVINDWYMTGDYHRDNGEGADFYGVGKSRGCGGLGLWAGGKLNVSRNFVSSRVLANGPIRLVFELRYAPWEVPPGRARRRDQARRPGRGDAVQPLREHVHRELGPAKISAGVGIAKHAGSAVTVDAAIGVAARLGAAQGVEGGRQRQPRLRDRLRPRLAARRAPRGARLPRRDAPAGERQARLPDGLRRLGPRQQGPRRGGLGREVQELAARAAAPVQVSLSAAK